MGGEVSERQWKRRRSILAVAPDLDAVYLRTWAAPWGSRTCWTKAVADLKRDQPL